MREMLSILLAILGATVIIGERTEIAETCFPTIPDECPNDPIEACPTCCCESSENVEFFTPNLPEPECTAPPALYEMKLVYTWTGVCHPDDYVATSQWISPVTATHNTDFRLWDACMDEVTDEVGTYSQNGDPAILDHLLMELLAGKVVDFTQDEPVTRDDPVTQGSGVTASHIVIDQFHQYASVISRQMPSPDNIVGVADLRLCDGAAWKESVKVCLELFSTATASDRVAGPMERNSVQGNNCSYGYIEFNLLDVHEYQPRTEIEEVCYPEAPEVCFRDDPIEECPTCCCRTSDNAEFYNPDLPEPVCTAPNPANYELTFVFRWDAICHPDFTFPRQVFTPPSMVSHNTEYKMWDACMDDTSIGVGILSQHGVTSVVEQQYLAAGDNVLDFSRGVAIRGGVGETSNTLTVDAAHQWVSVASMLAPSPDRMVGFADLRMCDGDEWKESMMLCLELFSTATATEKVIGVMERNSLQANNCSFGYVQLDLLPPPPPTAPSVCSPRVPEECPNDPIEECPTCCCESSENVEFYNPNLPEPECTAPPALYEMKLEYTWTGVCHPDDYVANSQWISPVTATHNTDFRLWDACMDDVTDEVGRYSQNGDPAILDHLLMELLAGKVVDFTQDEPVTRDDPVTQGSGVTASHIVIDQFHQYASVISRQMPSPDNIVGVADLRLCDGAAWKESVKVCLELFSTATASDRVAGPMERNSVQGNNCSYGYIEFNLLDVHEYQPRTEIEEVCYPEAPEVCFRDDPIEECPTCCCQTSDNVEFYNPDLPEPVCTAPNPANYELTFVFRWDAICHPDFTFPRQVFTPPSMVSHNTEYKMWDACMDDTSIGVGILSQHGVTSVVEQQYLAAGDNVLDFSRGVAIRGGVGETFNTLTVDAAHQWVSVASMLAPSPDRMVGFADLRMCDGDEWKESMMVCLELFSTATATEKVIGVMERNGLQANNCSFGYVQLDLLPPPPPSVCSPRVPEECPNDPIEECPTCCCESSENVEFYNPNLPEPECTAPPALYEMKLEYTWTGVCHPDDYVANSQWISPVTATHNTDFRLWDACMDDVTDEVGRYSQNGDPAILDHLLSELLRGNVVDFTQDEPVTRDDPVTQGSGVTASHIVIDQFHQYASVISRQVPSPDNIVGVADLRLCDGTAWKESVKVCLELFSTATASDRVAGPMNRNSVQGNNCSYGYIEFNLLDVHEFVPRTPLEDQCFPMAPEVCFRDDPIEECPTCCCQTSDNAEFYNPDLPEPVCTAPYPATYELTFVFRWDAICHPDFTFPRQVFTPPSMVSHNTEYKMWDACMDNTSIGVGILSQHGVTSVVEQQYLAAGDNVLDFSRGVAIRGGVGETSSTLTVDAAHQWVSVASMLAPSPDRMVGFADLRMCDGDEWKESMMVCLELFSTAAATEKVIGVMERNSLQANNCSFGYVQLNFVPPAIDVCSPMVPEECPNDPIEECPTCCCESSENVEFYNPNLPEPECTAPPALYEMKLEYTWTGVCHPDDYVANSQWISPVTATHNTDFRLWDACMDDVTDEVGRYSQNGDPAILDHLLSELLRGNVVDFTQDEPVTRDDPVTQGSGVTASHIVIDQFHQYTSVISRQMPSPDKIVGVADLRLCDGAAWKESVKVCLELFSTATASDRVAGPMERNSVQGNNCSYGYIEFNLLDVHEFEPRTPLEEQCFAVAPEKCPRDDPIEECPTCCCETSDNAEFYNPNLPEPKCKSPFPALYEVTFFFRWNAVCHPDFTFPRQVFTPPSMVSHNTEYKLWDACMDDTSIGVGILSQHGVTSVVEQQYLAAGDNVLDFSRGVAVRGGVGETSNNLTLNATYQWVSVASMLAPSPDRMVGFADLRMCDGYMWKESVTVCLELFSTATATEKVNGVMERNSLQANNCSFGYVQLNLLSSAATKTMNIVVAFAAIAAALLLMN